MDCRLAKQLVGARLSTKRERPEGFSVHAGPKRQMAAVYNPAILSELKDALRCQTASKIGSGAHLMPKSASPVDQPIVVASFLAPPASPGAPGAAVYQDALQNGAMSKG